MNPKRVDSWLMDNSFVALEKSPWVAGAGFLRKADPTRTSKRWTASFRQRWKSACRKGFLKEKKSYSRRLKELQMVTLKLRLFRFWGRFWRWFLFLRRFGVYWWFFSRKKYVLRETPNFHDFFENNRNFDFKCIFKGELRGAGPKITPQCKMHWKSSKITFFKNIAFKA